ncbi:MAG: C10 family peptidase [Phocaeicola sp.]|nr:C10 family peptidase [Phocaeicola sp.]
MRIIIPFLFMIFLLIGCKEQDDVRMHSYKPVDNGLVVSLDMAIDAATYFLYMTDNQIQTRKAVRDVKDVSIIKQRFTINGFNGKPAMHVINYENGGYTIVSGDKRIQPIIAYSDVGEWDDDISHYPDGLQYWIECIKNEIKAMDEQGVEQTEEIRRIWDTYIPVTSTRIITPPSHPCEHPEDSEVLVGPLINTSWNQGSPYNELMPMVLNCSGTDSIKAAAGCVPVAVGQVGNYWQYPTSYSWNSMGNNAVIANFIKDIHDYYLSIPALSYLCNGETGVIIPQISKIFSVYWGYNTVYSSAYSTNNLRNHFYNNTNVTLILTGYSGNNAHTWICDGYYEWINCFYIEDNWQWSTESRFHMNWGWGSNYNGWFIPGTTYSQNGYTFGGITILHVLP